MLNILSPVLIFLEISDWWTSCFSNAVANWLSLTLFLFSVLLIIVTGVGSLGLLGVVFDSFGITVFGVLGVLGLFGLGVIPPPFGFWSGVMLLGVAGLFGLFGLFGLHGVMSGKSLALGILILIFTSFLYLLQVFPLLKTYKKL